MNEQEFRLRALAIYLAALTEYPAPWLKNAGTVTRDQFGRFTKQGGALGVGDGGVSAGDIIKDYFGTKGREIEQFAEDKKKAIQLIFSEPDKGLGLDVLREEAALLGEGVSKKALASIDFIGNTFKHPKKTISEKFEQVGAFASALKDTTEYDSKEYADIIGCAIAMGVGVAVAIGATTSLLSSWKNPIALLRNLEFLSISKGIVPTASHSIKEDIDTIFADANKGMLARMGEQIEKDGYEVIQKKTGSAVKKPRLIAKKIYAPEVYETALSVKDELLNASSGKERAEIMLKASGYPSYQAIEQEIATVLGDRISQPLFPFNLTPKEKEKIRSLNALRYQVSELRFEEGSRGETQTGYAARMKKTEKLFGKDLDKILLAESDQELQDSYNSLMSKISSPVIEKKKANTGKIRTGSVYESAGLLDFDKKEEDVCDRTLSIFQDMFGDKFGNYPIVKYDTKLTGPFFDPNGKTINFDHLLTPLTPIYKLAEKMLADPGMRLPQSLSLDKTAESALFHELCHTLEVDSNAIELSKQAIKMREESLENAISASTGIRGTGSGLGRTILMATHDNYGDLEYKDPSGNRTIATEFLTTGAERLLDPGTLQSAVSLDREKILYALSFTKAAREG